MSLPGCEWESIERYEKLCGVVSQCEKSKPHFLQPGSRSRRRGSLAAAELSPTNVVHRGACGITYLATTYQRQCSKELFKFQGR